jgi:AsmA protein
MRRLLIALGVLIVLVVIAVVAAPFVISTDVYVNRVTALVQSATGRDFRIGGPVRLSLVPQLEIDAQNVSLASAPGAASPQMVQIKELQLQLRLRPLLHGTVEFGRFALVEPVIALEVDKQGHPNWLFAPAKPAAPPPAAVTQAAPAAHSPISSVSLSSLQLEQGKISYFDQRSGERQELDDVFLKLVLPSLDEPSSLSGSAVWNNQKVALAFAVDKPSALLLGGATPVKLSVDSAPVKVAFDGAISDLAAAKLNGTVDLSVPSVRELATWTGTPMGPGNGFGPLAIKGKLDVAGAKYAFNDATVALDTIKGTGSLAVDTGGTRPYVQAQLAVDRLDLNPYLPAQSMSPASTGAAAPASAANKQPIDLGPLKVADADFALSAGALLYRKIQIGQSALTLHLKDGKLTADLTRAALYDGSGKGTVTLDGSGDIPAVAANFNFAGLQVGPLLVAAAGTDRLTGRGSFALNVTARGHDNDELLHALNGSGSLNIANGAIKGVNLVGVAQTALSALTQGATTGDETAFGALSGTYTISNGIVHNNDLRLSSGLVPVQGAGTIDLPQETLNYRVTVQIAGQVPVPIELTGPINNISYHPDLAAALQDVAKNPGAVLKQLTPKPPAKSNNPVDGLLNGLIRR